MLVHCTPASVPRICCCAHEASGPSPVLLVHPDSATASQLEKSALNLVQSGPEAFSLSRFSESAYSARDSHGINVFTISLAEFLSLASDLETFLAKFGSVVVMEAQRREWQNETILALLRNAMRDQPPPTQSVREGEESETKRSGLSLVLVSSHSITPELQGYFGITQPVSFPLPTDISPPPSASDDMDAYGRSRTLVFNRNTLSFFLMYLHRAKAFNPSNSFLSIPSRSLLQEAEDFLVSMKILKIFSSTAATPNSVVGSTRSHQLTDLGYKCLKFRPQELEFALAALHIASSSENSSLAAAFFAATSDGVSISEKYSLADLNSSTCNMDPELDDSYESEERRTPPNWMSGRLLTESEIGYSMCLFMEWLQSSTGERVNLEQKHQLMHTTMLGKESNYLRSDSVFRSIIGDMKKDPNGDSAFVMIGKALAECLPDTIAQLLVPSQPELGICLLESGTHAKLSPNALLAIISPNASSPSSSQPATELICGLERTDLSAVSMCHPINSQWLSPAQKRRINQRDHVACFSQSNLHPSFQNEVAQRLPAGLKESTFLHFDVGTLTLTAYCPRDLTAAIGPLIKALVDERIQTIQKSQTYVSYGPARVTVSSGFTISNVEASDQRVLMTAPKSVSSNDELASWLTNVAQVSPCNVTAVDYNPSGPSTVLLHDAKAANVLTNFLNDASSDQLDGAELVIGANADQNATIFVSFDSDSESTPLQMRQAISLSFPSAQTKMKGDNRVQVVLSSAQEAQRALDHFGAKATSKVVCSVPAAASNAYQTVLPEYAKQMQRIFPALSFTAGTTSITIEGRNTKEIRQAQKSLNASLLSTPMSTSGTWAMFYTECIRSGWKPDVRDVLLDIDTKDSAGKNTGFARNVTLFGPQAQQGIAIAHINQRFNSFKCEIVDASAVAHNFSRSTSNGAKQLTTLLSNPKFASSSCSYDFDPQTGLIFVYQKLHPEGVISDADFSSLVRETKSLVSSLQSNPNNSAVSSGTAAPSGSSCGFCGNLNPDGQSSHCGHGYCQSCLCAEVLKAKEIKCSHCDTAIPIKDFPRARMPDLLSQSVAAVAKAHSATPQASHSSSAPSRESNVKIPKGLQAALQLSVSVSSCPNPVCSRKAQTPAADSNSYKMCEDCFQNTCMLCGTCDNPLHEGLTCQQFDQKVRTSDSMVHLEAIYKMAEAFADTVISPTIGKPVEKTRNPWLPFGSNSMHRFVKGVALKGGVPLLNNPIFAWHGTHSDAITPICQEGFDPNRRRGQFYGIGEYFGPTPDISMGYCKPGNHNHVLILSCLLNIKEVTRGINSRGDHYCYVVNNPISWVEAYCLPVLLIRFEGDHQSNQQVNSKNILNFNPAKVATNTFVFPGTRPPMQVSASAPTQSTWKWRDQRGFVAYIPSDTNSLERAYQNWRSSNKSSTIQTCTLNCVRLDGTGTDAYLINFSTMVQTNVRTNYQRAVERNGS